jgi:hypothetical protein
VLAVRDAVLDAEIAAFYPFSTRCAHVGHAGDAL